MKRRFFKIPITSPKGVKISFFGASPSAMMLIFPKRCELQRKEVSHESRRLFYGHRPHSDFDRV